MRFLPKFKQIAHVCINNTHENLLMMYTHSM